MGDVAVSVASTSTKSATSATKIKRPKPPKGAPPAPAPQVQLRQQGARPPPLPSAYDGIILPPGKTREDLPIFQRVYSTVYYQKGEKRMPSSPPTKLRDCTRGKITLAPRIEYLWRPSEAGFWPRDARMRDPIETAWYYLRDLFTTPSTQEQFEAILSPKWVSFDELLKCNTYVPLRNYAPVYCALRNLGLCVAYAANVRYISMCYNQGTDIPFLVVKPVAPFGDAASTSSGKYYGALWCVPMATCLPMPMAVLSWAGVGAGQPDECLVLHDDGWGELLNVNYIAASSDPEVAMARLAILKDNPTALGNIGIPLKPTSPERAAAMAPYSLVRYGPPEPEEKKEDEEQPAKEEEADEKAPSEEVDSGVPDAGKEIPLTAAALRSQLGW